MSIRAAKYGDTADECGEAFFLCGKSLLELARLVHLSIHFKNAFIHDCILGAQIVKMYLSRADNELNC